MRAASLHADPTDRRAILAGPDLNDDRFFPVNLHKKRLLVNERFELLDPIQ